MTKNTKKTLRSEFMRLDSELQKNKKLGIFDYYLLEQYETILNKLLEEARKRGL